MREFKDRLRCLAPLVLGIYCLLQGGALAFSPNPVIQLLGLGLWLWLPGCAYYAWRERKALLPRAVVVKPVSSQPEAHEEDWAIAD